MTKATAADRLAAVATVTPKSPDTSGSTGSIERDDKRCPRTCRGDDVEDGSIGPADAALRARPVYVLIVMIWRRHDLFGERVERHQVRAASASKSFSGTMFGPSDGAWSGS